MTEIKILIVDDERNAREYLRSILERHDITSFKLIEGTSVAEAIEIIRRESLDIVLLDINLTDGNGFEVLDATLETDYHVIFTTAYDSYALKAIKYHAFDYLLKPVDPDELLNSIRLTIAQRRQNIGGIRSRDYLKKDADYFKQNKIAIPYGTGYIYLHTNDVLYFEADGSYTIIYVEKTKYLVSKKLKFFDELVNPKEFCRIHAKYVINLNRLKFFSKKNGGEVELDNGITLSVSRSRRPNLIDVIT